MISVLYRQQDIIHILNPKVAADGYYSKHTTAQIIYHPAFSISIFKAVSPLLLLPGMFW
jgi:hypothetical protein